MNPASLLLALCSALAPAAAAEEPHALAVIAVPLAAFDTSFGVGGGAYGQLVLADPTGERPYRLSVDAQAYLTSGRYQDHYLGWDLPGAFGSRVRWDMRLRYQQWDRAPYYGLGNHTPRVDASGDAYLWGIQRPFALTHLRVPLGSGPIELYLGGLVSVVAVDPPPGSLLLEESPVGIEGGLVTQLSLGLFRDTRTDEVDPSDGTALDLAVNLGLPPPLSEYRYLGGHASIRGWYPAGRRVVLAGHAVMDARTPGQPFFDQATFGGLQRTGVGGRYLLRGLVEQRLRGDGLVATQGEIRVRLGTTTVLRKTDLGWTAAAFADLGQVWTWDQPRTRVAPHPSAGLGLRTNVNGLLIVRLDGAIGVERWVDEPRNRPAAQLYVLAAQPF